MEVKFFKIVFKYTLILIASMYLKVLVMIPLSNSDSYGLKYEEVDIVNGDYSYSKPKFNSEMLNSLIDEYIDESTCVNFEYNVYELSDDTVNLYLNCGVPKNIVYNFVNSEVTIIDPYIKDIEKFKTSVTKLLDLKYPKFVTMEVSILDGVYNIKNNEIIAYFNTVSYGDISIRINNNEIKDLMTYEMHYDDTYENEVYTLDKNKKTIAFTFDDGPSNYDLEIIDALVDSHSTATFFLVGNRINNFKNSVFKMVETDMEVGNHTYDHKTMTKLADSSIVTQITRTNEIYRNLTGREMTLFRAPYGSVNNRVLLATKMPSILWSVDTLDWQSRNAQKVYDIIMNKVQDGDIILMHSLYPSTVEAVKMVIPELYKQGYQIVSVSKLFELKDRTIELGKNYNRILKIPG